MYLFMHKNVYLNLYFRKGFSGGSFIWDPLCQKVWKLLAWIIHFTHVIVKIEVSFSIQRNKRKHHHKHAFFPTQLSLLYIFFFLLLSVLPLLLAFDLMWNVWRVPMSKLCNFDIATSVTQTLHPVTNTACYNQSMNQLIKSSLWNEAVSLKPVAVPAQPWEMDCRCFLWSETAD